MWFQRSGREIVIANSRKTEIQIGGGNLGLEGRLLLAGLYATLDYRVLEI